MKGDGKNLEEVQKPPSNLNLINLPNDEFEKILGYIPVADKKNLKLASRICEQRVVELDPAMRTWTLKFKCYDEELISKCLELAEAKRRHTQDGTFKHIELNFEFNCVDPRVTLAAYSILND